jgi:hypothetical protein
MFDDKTLTGTQSKEILTDQHKSLQLVRKQMLEPQPVCSWAAEVTTPLRRKVPSLA